MTKVALPAGVYRIRSGAAGNAVTSPEKNGDPLALTAHDVNSDDQQFIVNNGLIFASFNRNSFAYAQTPSLLQESVKRSATGVAWIVSVERVHATDDSQGWKGQIISPDENKNYWTPSATRIILKGTKPVAALDWFFFPALPV